MKALINKNNKIVDIVQDDAVFEVHEDFFWVDCPDNIDIDYKYENGEFIKIEYIKDFNIERSMEYGSIGSQLDMIWHEINTNGSITKDGEWFNHIKSVKDNIPKGDV
jgi:hypothetical protein